jgi:hypothetical protein
MEPDEELHDPERRRAYVAVHSTHAMNEHIRRQGRGATFDEEQWGRIKQVGKESELARRSWRRVRFSRWQFDWPSGKAAQG